MKIAIILNNITGVGGVERVVTGFSNQISKRYNCEIHIISILSKSGEKTFYHLERNVKVIHLGSENLKNFKIFRSFINLFKDNYDYILGCSTPVNILTLFTRLIRRSKSKLFAWEHSQFDNTSHVMKLVRRLFYPKLDSVITLSKHDGELFSEFVGNTIVIPNFKPFNTEKKSNLNKSKFISVGRLGYEKGFDMLIDAFYLIHKKLDGWKLEIYGEGKEYEKLNEKIKLYELEDKVLLLPFNPNIQEKYLDSSVFICSSRSESFSMVIIEAMECGLPCVSFDCKIGPKEIISNGDDGFLVNVFNIEELAEKMDLLAGDYHLRCEMGAKAKKKSKNYNANEIMSIWEKTLGLNKL